MPLPSINIVFKTQGVTAIQRSEKGTVAIILRDAKEQGAHILTNATEIPAELSVVNRDYVAQAFLGYVNPPRKVMLCVIDELDDIETALEHFATQQFDYLVGPPDLDAAEAQTIASWVKSERQENHMVKAVLPNTAADYEGVINFTAEDIKVGESVYTAAGYCARIAGLIAGTPMTISCTYAPLPEVTSVKRLSTSQLDDAIDAGEFVLFHDGEKVKVARAVNSLVTTTQGKGKEYQKIKIVEAMDLIFNDIRKTAQDSYIGKYANSYDNKCLLIMAIKGYLEELERVGILERGYSTVGIDLAAQETYLKQQGTDTSNMTEQQIKQANTGSKVFLTASIRILDAIEDIDLIINI
ncbi:MAG TPA: phage tail sheath protein [Clostridiales bacterium]|nr:phage tail sheath protein [Clostridiales bacterium]